MEWLKINWSGMFVPSQPVLETIIRGSCMYVSTFLLLRMLRRQTGSLGPADLLVLLLIADAAQNGMAGEYKSVTDGLILISTIIVWEYLLDWGGFHSPRLQKVIEGEPLQLIQNGKVLDANLKRELITQDELLAQLRRKGVASPAEVAACYLEGDGHVSVILADRSKELLDDDDAEGGTNG